MFLPVKQRIGIGIKDTVSADQILSFVVMLVKRSYQFRGFIMLNIRGIRSMENI